ncbi:MAG: hypothetical protein MI749_11065, partial [Desulfovibrionales bacterium]|nr:hypothetical protein [Desulfovibrionales bacterium]
KNWLAICPRKQVTTLDTHDGIGVVDVMDLLTQKEIDQTLDLLYRKGSNIKQTYSGPDYENLDVYQINCTYYSALGCNDNAYITARCIQFFAPGIPQVYYVGLLAGENDIDLLERTRQGRDINRHNYTLEEVAKEVKKEVVKRLLRLMEFRNTHPAFNGRLTIIPQKGTILQMEWCHDSHRACAQIDVKTHQCQIQYTHPQTQKTMNFIP